MAERLLEEALAALATVKDQLVVVGGTAHRLFPLHELGQAPRFELLTTEDVDIVAPLELQHDGGSHLLHCLKEAGFEEEVRGGTEPAYIYRLRGQRGAYLQFLADLGGSGRKRSGKADRLMRFSGIHAEKLRGVGVLLHAPWKLRLRGETEPVELQVANPVSYLAQKLLCSKGRPVDKQAKDLLYIFDTIAIFAESLGELEDRAPDWLPPLSRKQKSTIVAAATSTCFEQSDVSRAAATIAREQRSDAPDSAQIVAACRLGLQRVLGPLFDG